jgi:hypothetical protein
MMKDARFMKRYPACDFLLVCAGNPTQALTYRLGFSEYSSEIQHVVQNEQHHEHQVCA